MFFGGAAFASHEAEIQECNENVSSGPALAQCQEAVREAGREDCRSRISGGAGAAQLAECLEHFENDAAETRRVEAGGSNLECGNGGVQLGVGVGGDGEDCVGQGDKNPIFDYLGGIISFLSVGVGVVVTAMIMVGGIQYAAAGGNPQAVQAAKSRITNAIIALVLYAFMVGILNFLVPGGVL